MTDVSPPSPRGLRKLLITERANTTPAENIQLYRNWEYRSVQLVWHNETQKAGPYSLVTQNGAIETSCRLDFTKSDPSESCNLNYNLMKMGYNRHRGVGGGGGGGGTVSESLWRGSCCVVLSRLHSAWCLRHLMFAKRGFINWSVSVTVSATVFQNIEALGTGT